MLELNSLGCLHSKMGYLLKVQAGVWGLQTVGSPELVSLVRSMDWKCSLPCIESDPFRV